MKNDNVVFSRLLNKEQRFCLILKTAETFETIEGISA